MKGCVTGILDEKSQRHDGQFLAVFGGLATWFIDKKPEKL